MIEANLRAKRADSGSRFNVRYRNGIPSDALTPDGLRRALAQYVDFGGGAPVASAEPPPRTGVAPRKKGLLLEDVEAILGPAATATEKKEGRLTVLDRTYRKDGQRVVASFINGVMIDFTITPQ